MAFERLTESFQRLFKEMLKPKNRFTAVQDNK